MSDTTSLTSLLPIAYRPGTYAKRLGVSRAFVYTLIRDKVITARKLGDATMIFEEDNLNLRQSLPMLELEDLK